MSINVKIGLYDQNNIQYYQSNVPLTMDAWNIEAIHFYGGQLPATTGYNWYFFFIEDSEPAF